jgi:uncharacterized C2H2 Zn-finger protein
LKCDHCSDIFKNHKALAAHIIKDHSTKQNVSVGGKKNVKCDKCNSQFTSKMALSQHMSTTHTPTRIEETGIFCNLCGEEFWTELDIIKHLKEHINGNKTDEPFFCKLCGIGLCDKNAINKHMINHVENVLKEDLQAKEANNMVVEKLGTITGNEDEVKSEHSEADDYDYYEGFDEDGNRIVDKED